MIVVFGGAFNPPTKAHQAIYHHVMKHLPCSLFIYLPVSNLYTKRSLASNFHRIEMLKLLIRDLPNAIVSSMECEDSDYLGTYQSLIRIQEANPTEEVVFVIGADNLAKLHKWINAESLLSEFRFIVINRNQTDIEAAIMSNPMLASHRHQFILLPDFNVDISSTQFRETMDQAAVTKPIYEYIQINHLF